MAFRSRRQGRYRLLRTAGFLPFEAQALSKVSLKTPYFDAMIKERYKELRQALDEDWTRKQWKEMIYGRYEYNDWFEIKDPSKRSPWAMLRHFEREYRRKHPQYKSPWEKRKKSWKEFVSMVEKDMAQKRTWEDRGDKYPPGYGRSIRDEYRRLRRELGE